MLTFDPETHEYRWHGQKVPHVTGVISDLTNFDMIPPATLELARAKGKAIHSMVEMWANGVLGERESQPEWIRPVYDEFMRFVDESGLKVISSEKRVYHPIFKYAGTYDLVCCLRNKSGLGIIDIKRTLMSGPVVGVQLAAYREALNQDKSREPIEWRAALKLNEKEKYRLVEHEDTDDWAMFLACLTKYNWMKKRGKL